MDKQEKIQKIEKAIKDINESLMYASPNKELQVRLAFAKVQLLLQMKAEILGQP